MHPGRLACELFEASRACSTPREFLRLSLETLGRIAPFESAILVKPPSIPLANINKEEFLHLHMLLRHDPACYAPGLSKGRAALERLGGYLDLDVYSAAERRNLPFYADVIRPQHIGSMLNASIRFRSRPGTIIYLCRHSRGTPFRGRDLEGVMRLLPALAVAHAAAAPWPEERTASAPSETPSTTALERLTPREREVAGHASRGLRNQDIASMLGTSAHTVHNQLQRIYRQLGIGGRTELAVAILAGSRRQEPARSAAADVLTSRESQIAACVCRGLRTKDIALVLGTSVNTIHNQLQRLYEKLRVAGRTELAAAVIRERPRAVSRPV